MGEVMELEGCHLCRASYPFDAMTVDMIADIHTTEFKGNLDIVIHAAVGDNKGPCKDRNRRRQKTEQFENLELTTCFMIKNDMVINVSYFN